MPPRAAKKTPAGPGQKKAGAGAKGPNKSPKPAAKPSTSADAPKAEEQVTATLTSADAPKAEEKHSEAVETPFSIDTETPSKDAPVPEKPVDEGKAEKECPEAVKIDEAEPGAVKEKKELTADDGEEASKDEAVKGEGLEVKEMEVVMEEAQEEVAEAEGPEGEEEGGERRGEDYEEELIGDEEGHPQDVEMPATVKERRKQKEFEVFVGGLDKDATEEDLKKVFSEVGEVVEIRLARNPQTKKNKGFAFIRYATVEQAKMAVAELKNPQVKGKRCGVTRSQDNETLYVRNINRSWTKDTLRDKLKEYGIDNVEETTLMDDPLQEGKNRGFAFLEFSTHLDATNAFKRLQKRDIFFGVDVSAKVAFAKSGIEPDEEVMAQVKSVFVDGVPPAWDEDQVKEKFNKYGEIEMVQLARNMPTAKRKDFGFINFTTREAALACIEGVNKNELSEGDNKVNLKATLRKPQQKGRSVKEGIRGGHQVGYGGGRGGRVPWGRGGSVQYGGRFDARGGRNFQSEREYYNARDIPDRARHLPSSGRMYDRRPPAQDYLRSSYRRDYREEDEFYLQRPARTSSRSAAAIPRRPLYDDYGYDDSYPESMAASRARIPPRRAAYAEDAYGPRMDDVSAYHNAPVRTYDVLSGSKRPFSDLDQDLTYAGPSTRRPRTHLDHDLGTGPIGSGRAGGFDGGSYGNLYTSRNVGGYGPRGGTGSYY
uniref:TSA: Wollemia nobilis Ref_Wollemi_Transcript_4346_2585 transcribed RNA sequence n=1 Tax=Wollemia nobilis TaxID=56998 RepID=A0A0C9RY74_9CONI